MNTVKKIIILALVVAVCFALAGCGAFEGYDDDEVIIKTTRSASTGSVENSLTAGKYSFTAVKFNGVKKLASIDIPENPVFNFELTVEGGKFKIVLIKDGIVRTIAEYIDGEKVEIDNNSIAAGEYSLRIVGQDASTVAFVFYYSYT